jgi:16S rRNA (adenine1518-N6/adenine1519-N6)-dimethyltransferase
MQNSEFLPDYNAPSSIKQFLEDRGMAMQKKFGQNFLINQHAREKLIQSLGNIHNSSIWEVGPGLGCMTALMLEKKARVTAFEIDKGFSQVLAKAFTPSNFPDYGAFRLIEGDVLKTWKKEYSENGLPDYFFGNLPYNIAAAIIADMISCGARFNAAVVTVQKEVAQRMEAKPGTQDYSSFSVLCQWAYDISAVADLSGGSFWPKPNVDSRAVKMVKKEDFPRCKSIEHFMKIQRSLFVSRRKTVKNNLGTFYKDMTKAEMILNKAGIDPQIRAEKLSLEELLYLSDCSYMHLSGEV